MAALVYEAAHALLFEVGLGGGSDPDGYYHEKEISTRLLQTIIGLESGY
jgi:hypothetical protein